MSNIHTPSERLYDSHEAMPTYSVRASVPNLFVGPDSNSINLKPKSAHNMQ